MQKFLRLFLLFGCLAAPLLAQRNLGDINVNADSKTIAVRVAANTPELNALVHLAFKAHGRYRLPASGPYAYEMMFTAVGAQQVRVEVTKGSARTPVVTETVSGSSARNALLRAPLAVQQGQSTRLVMNGPGFSIQSEGQALANASRGDRVRVKTPSGEVVSGVAQDGQQVVVAF